MRNCRTWGMGEEKQIQNFNVETYPALVRDPEVRFCAPDTCERIAYLGLAEELSVACQADGVKQARENELPGVLLLRCEPHLELSSDLDYPWNPCTRPATTPVPPQTRSVRINFLVDMTKGFRCNDSKR